MTVATQATVIALPLWQVISLAVTLIGAFAALVKILFAQFAARVELRLGALAAESKGWRKVELDLMQLRIDLPNHYVRREDYIRGQTVIEAKLDAINAKVEVVQLQGAAKRE